MNGYSIDELKAILERWQRILEKAEHTKQYGMLAIAEQKIEIYQRLLETEN